MSRQQLCLISVIDVEHGGRLDFQDTDTAHVWVTISSWSPRRAYLTGAQPFAAAADCKPGELVDRHFVAKLPTTPPSSDPEDTAGERLEWPGLQVCPDPPDGWMGTSRVAAPTTPGTAETALLTALGAVGHSGHSAVELVENLLREHANRIEELGQARGWSTWAAQFLHPDREFIDPAAEVSE